MPDLWQALTKTALRIIHERDGKLTLKDVDTLTDDVLRFHADIPNVRQYRDRLKAFITDIVRL